jgi:3',5'-cyclic AMP phosphodiesterase CpdA
MSEDAKMKSTHHLLIVSMLAGLLSGPASRLAGLALASPLPLPETALAQTADPVFVGAGDISGCNQTQDESTAQLLDGMAGTVFTLGDNVYPDGTLAQFNDCYGPTWGRHKARTRPAPGNHDYHTAGAAGYYTYFGAAASPLDTKCTSNCKGYYSYNLGAWHIIALNSEVAHGAGSAQEQWLRADLAAHPNTCTLAYWHKPRFSSGNHGNNTGVQPFWQALYEYGADVVLNGHDHTYERFAPQTPAGQADPTRGMREFVVGTGGAGLYPFPTIRPNSQVRNNTTWGVLKLTLHATSYDWEFIPVAGQTFTDVGSANCVGAGPAPDLPFDIYLPIVWRGKS